jgi:hypothetical protein
MPLSEFEENRMLDLKIEQTGSAGKLIARRGRRTQWAAQFAVASELCKRGYEVAFTMGNCTPVADLMVISPINRTPFLVDVKGLYAKNPWVISRKPKRDQLFYILSFVPDDAPNEFFILTQEEVLSYVGAELVRLGRPPDYRMTGILWKQALAHRGRWDVLPH